MDLRVSFFLLFFQKQITIEIKNILIFIAYNDMPLSAYEVGGNTFFFSIYPINLESLVGSF